jgi:hypothetical protein
MMAMSQQAQTMDEIPLGGSGASSLSSMSSAEAMLDGTGGGTASTAASATDPEAVAFDGTYIWIATQFDDRLTRIRVSDRSVAGTFTVGKRPVALLYAGSYVWVANLLSNNSRAVRSL